MDRLLESLATQGPAVTILIAMLIYFYRRDMRNEIVQAERAVKCDERTALAETKIQRLEDERYADTKTLLVGCLNALSSNAKAFEKLTEIESKREESGTYVAHPKHKGKDS